MKVGLAATDEYDPYGYEDCDYDEEDEEIK